MFQRNSGSNLKRLFLAKDMSSGAYMREVIEMVKQIKYVEMNEFIMIF